MSCNNKELIQGAEEFLNSLQENYILSLFGFLSSLLEAHSTWFLPCTNRYVEEFLIFFAILPLCKTSDLPLGWHNFFKYLFILQAAFSTLFLIWIKKRSINYFNKFSYLPFFWWITLVESVSNLQAASTTQFWIKKLYKWQFIDLWSITMAYSAGFSLILR